jgi:hypothetical protein
MLDDVVFDVGAHHAHDFGELHALAATVRYWPALISWLDWTGSGG